MPQRPQPWWQRRVPALSHARGRAALADAIARAQLSASRCAIATAAISLLASSLSSSSRFPGAEKAGTNGTSTAHLHTSASAPRRCEHPAQPIQTLVKPVTSGRASRLDEPLPIPHARQSEFLRHLGAGHGIRQVLLVGDHKQRRLAHLVLAEHGCKLLARVLDAVAVAAVDDEDRRVRACVPM